MTAQGPPGILCWGALLVLAAAPRAAQPGDDAQSRAIALYRQGNFRQACPIFAELASRDSRNAGVQLYLIGCATHRRDGKAIAAARENLRRLAPPPAVAHAMAGDWLASAGYCLEAEEEYARAPAPGVPGTAEFALAQCEQITGNLDSALKRYRNAIEADPAREERHLSLAFLLIGMGESDEAGKVLVEAARRFPDSARVLVTMSLLHLELGYTDRARIGYEKVRALEPDTPMTWKLLGRIQTAEGSFQEAVKSLERAAALDPKDAQTHLFLGMARGRVEGGSDKALADFSRALQIDPAMTEARFQTALIYFQHKEDYAKAAAELERVIAAAPGYARAHTLLVQAYQRLGQTGKAAAAAKRYRELGAR